MWCPEGLSGTCWSSYCLYEVIHCCNMEKNISCKTNSASKHSETTESQGLPNACTLWDVYDVKLDLATGVLLLRGAIFGWQGLCNLHEMFF